MKYPEKRNFLIVTASIGAGHNRAAEAIGNEIKGRYPQAGVHIVDFMSTKTAYLNGFLKDAYLKMLRLVPDVYEFLYGFSAGRVQGLSIQSLLALAMKSDMQSLIRRYEADVVICTHPFPCAAAAYLKKTGQADIVLAGAITDFAVHQLWVYRQVDLYFVGNERLKRELEGRGIEAGKVFATGIPIHASFNKPCDRAALFRQFGFADNTPVLLIMGGGLGLGGVECALSSLEALRRPVQIFVVAGENQRLWANLQKRAASSKNKIQVWGFSQRIQELMAVSTLLITKPGALTVSEAMAMELPMVLNEPIPGQERENAAYVERTGAAVWVKSGEDLAAAVEALLKAPEKLSRMRESARRCKQPQAAREIVARLDELLYKRCESTVAGM